MFGESNFHLITPTHKSIISKRNSENRRFLSFTKKPDAFTSNKDDMKYSQISDNSKIKQKGQTWKKQEVKDILSEIKKSVKLNRKMRRLRSNMNSKSISKLNDGKSSNLTTERSLNKNRDKSKSKSRSRSNTPMSKIKSSNLKSIRHYKKLMLGLSKNNSKIKLKNQHILKNKMYIENEDLSKKSPTSKKINFDASLSFHHKVNLSDVENYLLKKDIPKKFKIDIMNRSNIEKSFQNTQNMKYSRKSNKKMKHKKSKKLKKQENFEVNQESVKSFRNLKGRFSYTSNLNKKKQKENCPPPTKPTTKTSEKSIDHNLSYKKTSVVKEDSQYYTPKVDHNIHALTDKKPEIVLKKLIENRSEKCKITKLDFLKNNSFNNTGKTTPSQRNLQKKDKKEASCHHRTPSEFNLSEIKSK